MLNKNSASAFESSVFPTPLGPKNMKLPDGRRGSFKPARLRLMAFERAVTASSWPITRSCKTPSMRKSFSVSASVKSESGTPVIMLTTSAISLSPISLTCCFCSSKAAFIAFSRSRRSASSFSFSSPARSNFCSDIARSFFVLTWRNFSSNLRTSSGSVMFFMRMRAPASSITSIALSGKNLSCT